MAEESITIKGIDLVEPIAAEGEPPTDDQDRNRGADGPPERQREIGNQTEPGEAHPKDFLLHATSVTPIGTAQSEYLANLYQLR